MSGNPIQPFIDATGCLILDGGLATELESRGYDLRDRLWSARLLIEDPQAIRDLHRDYLAAGADCLITASYQASFPGFAARGIGETEATALFERSVALACEERDAFWQIAAHRKDRLRPLVAASVGPYGAYLADGSEYRGNYDIAEPTLLAFHRRRWEVLAGSAADLLACETIPSLPEARVLRLLLQETPGVWAWFSFTARDGAHISDGTAIEDCASLLEGAERVAAIGINCTPPRLIPELISRLRQATRLPIIVYPNSGEAYDAASHSWHGERDPADYADASVAWRQQGAVVIGGCCRTSPGHIAAVRARLFVGSDSAER